jgi:hypothetical protein
MVPWPILGSQDEDSICLHVMGSLPMISLVLERTESDMKAS